MAPRTQQKAILDRDIIPILEREDEDEDGFYSSKWRYSNCHPKAPPPSPAPSSDHQLSTVNRMTSSPVWDLLPLLLPQRSSTASDATVPSMVYDRRDSSSDEDYGGFKSDERRNQHPVTAQPPESFKWLAMDYDVNAPSHTLSTGSPYGLQLDSYGSSPGGQQVYVDSSCYGSAITTQEKTSVPTLPPTLHTSPPQPRTRSGCPPAPRPLGGTFSVFPYVPSNANAGAAISPRCREPFPVLQTEQSVFEDYDDDPKHRRFGAFSSHIHLPSLPRSGEQRKALKKKASGILRGILSCG